MAHQALEKPQGLTRRNAIRLAWERGRLRWKLDPSQREIYDSFHTLSKTQKRFYLNCGRRWGKSYLIGVIAIEKALACPGAIVKVVCPTAKAARQIVKPLYQEILKDCPKSLRPKWNNMDGEFRFANGSIVSIAGCEDGNEENLRGSKADLVLFDECGFIKRLSYAAKNILAPMLLTTGGWMVYASTPPPSSDHDAVDVFRTLQAKGAAFTRTIFDNPRLTDAQRDAFFEDERGLLTLEQFKQSVAFRREYLAEFVSDNTRQVVPEWDDAAAKRCVEERPRPEHFDAYTCFDWGFRRDASGGLFAYWDFLNAVLVIEDEFLAFKKRTEELAAGLVAKEHELWGERGVYLRIGDGGGMGAQVNEDMTLIHGLTFVPTAKDQKEMQVNQVRMWVQAGKLRIHPRCRHLIHQLYTTLWNERHTEFERNSSGHGDLLDSLIYLCRNVRREKNPYPMGWGLAAPGPNTLTNPFSVARPASHQAVAKIFGNATNLFGGKRKFNA